MWSKELLVGLTKGGGPVHTETTHISYMYVPVMYTLLKPQYISVYYTFIKPPLAVTKFFYPPLSSLLVATDPKNIRQKKAMANPFTTTHEGKLLITEEGDKGLTLEQGELWSQPQTQNQFQCRSLSVSGAG